MMGSENPSISTGTDYSFLSAFNYAQSGEDVGRAYVDMFYQQSVEQAKWYGCYGILDVTYSCIKLSEIDNVITAADSLFKAATKDMKTMYPFFSLIRDGVKGVHDEGGDPNVGTPNFYDLIDIYDFAMNYRLTYQNEADALIQALDRAIVYNRATSDKMKGLTFYSPYRSDLKAEYSQVCLSNAYSDYISAFMKEKKGETSFDWTFSSLQPVTSALPGGVSYASLQLTDEQVKDFTHGEYYVFAKPRNITDGNGNTYVLQDDEYMFVSNGFDVSLDNNILKADISGKGCYVSDGVYDMLCPLYTMRDGEKTVQYTMATLTRTSEIEGDNADEELESLVEAVENLELKVGRIYLNISGDNVDVGPIFLISDDGLYQRSSLSPDYYNEVSFDTFVKKMGYDNNAKLLPFNEWTALTDKMLTHSHRTKELSMKMKPLESDMDYYVMIVAHDIYGNKNCSGIVPLSIG